MTWEQNLLGILSRAENDKNRTAGRPRMPQRSSDFTRAIHQGHPNFIIDERKPLRIAIVGLGRNPDISALTGTIYRLCRSYPLPIDIPLGGAKSIPLPDDPQVSQNWADGLVVNTKHSVNADLVILVTDGSCGWPHNLIRETAICLLGDAVTPPFFNNNLVRVPARKGPTL